MLSGREEKKTKRKRLHAKSPQMFFFLKVDWTILKDLSFHDQKWFEQLHGVTETWEHRKESNRATKEEKGNTTCIFWLQNSTEWSYDNP